MRGRSKHNRTNSAEAILSIPQPKQRNGNLPVVGGLALVEGRIDDEMPLGNGNLDSPYDSPRGTNSRSGKEKLYIRLYSFRVLGIVKD